MFAKNVPQTGNTSSLPTCKDLWGLTVALAGTDPASILLPQDRACTETGARCTADGQVLSTGLGQSVPGPTPQSQQRPWHLRLGRSA